MNGAGRQTAPLQHSCPGSPPSRHERLGPRHIEHAPLSQLRAPEHVPPDAEVAQHIMPSVPQSLGTGTHMRIDASQIRPSSQMLRGRQGSPIPPAVVALPHMPPRHSRPPEHVAPGAQQGCPSSPQSVGAWHVPPMQKSEPAHPVAPSQQGCPSSPHAAQRPVAHTLPALHVKPAQHVMPGLPHIAMPVPGSVGGVTQRPASHKSPRAQSLEPRQPAPAGATHSPAVHVKPTQQSLDAVQRAPPGTAQHSSPRPHVSPSSQVRPAQQPPPTVPQRGAGPPPPSACVAPSRRGTEPSRLPASGASSPDAHAASATRGRQSSERRAAARRAENERPGRRRIARP